MDMANVPDDAEITEIPLDIDNQVAILFVVPNDDKYYCLYAGHWNNNTESMQPVALAVFCMSVTVATSTTAGVAVILACVRFSS